MQNAALRRLGLAGEWSYEAIEMPPADFGGLTRALPDEGFVGANVTIPHKEAALKIADEASAAATEIGAANTLSFRDGRIRAENTDAPGLLAALERPPSGTRALVLGAGGSARAAAWALASQGAGVDVWNRTPERADELVRDIGGTLGAGGDGPLLAPVSDDQAKAARYDLIVNCTAVGLEGEGDPFSLLPLEAEALGKQVTLVDFVYGDEETALVAEGTRRGARVIDGIELLVLQGGESLRIWTGMEPPLEVMREAARGA
jgi:shikimate dehydrogenase